MLREPPPLEPLFAARRAFGLLLVLPCVASGACFFRIADVRQPDDGGTVGGSAGSITCVPTAVLTCPPCDAGCAGGGCAPGACQLVTLAETPPSALNLVLDTDDVYWTANDGLYRTAKSGGAEWFKKIAEGSSLSGLAIDEQWVYFADAANQRVAKVEKAGGYPQTVVSTEGPFAVALDAGTLFYGSSTGKVFRVNTDGSGVRELASLTGTRPEAIWSVWGGATELFFGDSDARGIFAVAKDGSTAARLVAKTTRDVFGVAGDAESLFFREGDGSDGTLSAVPAGGEASAVLTGEVSPAGVAVDSGSVYFVAGSGGSMIRRYDRASKRVSSLAEGRASARSLAVDDVALYWTEFGSGRVSKLAK